MKKYITEKQLDTFIKALAEILGRHEFYTHYVDIGPAGPDREQDLAYQGIINGEVGNIRERLYSIFAPIYSELPPVEETELPEYAPWKDDFNKIQK